MIKKNNGGKSIETILTRTLFIVLMGAAYYFATNDGDDKNNNDYGKSALELSSMDNNKENQNYVLDKNKDEGEIMSQLSNYSSDDLMSLNENKIKEEEVFNNEAKLFDITKDRSSNSNSNSNSNSISSMGLGTINEGINIDGDNKKSGNYCKVNIDNKV